MSLWQSNNKMCVENRRQLSYKYYLEEIESFYVPYPVSQKIECNDIIAEMV